ncbi:MAG: STAS-like domain-containing protein [Pirellulales bacterium]|nr:STAS-like domain-containing protein [Pirellulales bacterium]
MAEFTAQSAQLNMSDFGNLLVTRDQGELARKTLMRLLQEHEQVEVVLDNVDAYTPSFVDEVLGKCMLAIGTPEFRRSVRLVATTPEVRKLVNLVLSNRSGKNLP